MMGLAINWATYSLALPTQTPELRVLPQPERREQDNYLESLEDVLELALKNQGPERTARFLSNLQDKLRQDAAGTSRPSGARTAS